MSRTSTAPTSRIEITEHDGRWGPYLEVVVNGITHSCAIIDGTVMTGANVDDSVRRAIEARGYDTAP